MNKILFRTSQTPPKSTQPLFIYKEVDTLDRAPSVLDAGDIVICFTFFPNFYQVGTLEGEFVSLDISGKDFTRLAQSLFEAFRNSYSKEWKARCDPSSDKPDLSVPTADPEPDTLGLGTGFVSPVSLTLKSSKKLSSFFAYRAGLIEAGSVVGIAANQVWLGNGSLLEKARRTFMKQLKDIAGGDESFGPTAVSKVAALDPPSGYKKQYTEFQDAVGRGLAYIALHEFWHASRGRQGHPKDESGGYNLRVIETPSSPSFRTDLVLLDASITEIIKNYEASWCSFIQAGAGRTRIDSTR